ncbi:MAG TPA: UDP-glucose/GDP-mannose dehydrogenase family protein [Candidatus Kapabacteria bacterium]|nr:UDP-glucose/GDP-mannose dehydrogenase family protein [Candidatus Kapabacteria bacterium]
MPYTIAVVGTGYVGLVSGTCFADIGNQVHCVDIDPKKIEMLEAGGVPIYEPGLDLLLERNIRERRIWFTLDLKSAVLKSDVIFLCLPTPPDEDGSADLKYILGVADQIGVILQAHPDAGYKVIVDKSTVPVGTSELVRDAIRRNAPDGDFDVVSNPEFLREGFAVDDCMRPERVVVGTSSRRAETIMRDLYEPFLRSGNPIFVISERSAEIAKYAANSFVAMRISFINEMANFCEKIGANIDDVRAAIGSDSRIGKKYLYPSVGYGGSCFPKDVRAILKSSADFGTSLQVIEAVEQVNKRQPLLFCDKIRTHFQGDLTGRRIAIWGLSYKANTDDTRESPAFVVIDHLLEAGAEVVAYDPEAMEGTRRRYGTRIVYASSMYETIKGADALAILTEWNEFRNPDFGRVTEALKQRVIFDGRNLFNSEEMAGRGYTYYSIGRALVPVSNIAE